MIVVGKNKNVKDVTEVYDSLSKTWKTHGVVSSGCHPSSPTVVCGGVLYFWCDPDGLVSFNMESKMWEKLDTLVPSKHTLLAQVNIKALVL